MAKRPTQRKGRGSRPTTNIKEGTSSARGDNRIIDGYRPVFITRIKKKKHPNDPEETEQRNIFAMNLSEFKAFTFDMHTQHIETINRIEQELGRQARQIRDVLIPFLQQLVDKLPEPEPETGSKSETDQEETDDG